MEPSRKKSWFALLTFVVVVVSQGEAFVPFLHGQRSGLQSKLQMIYRAEKGTRRRTGPERSKRQERVGHLVQSELARIIHTGVIRGDYEYLEDDLRKRISIVKTDVSPDLRQARITVSIRRGLQKAGNTNEEDEEDDDYEDGTTASSAAVDQRRAYSWLVQNSKAIRHTLAQRMSHMKVTPNLSFAQVDIAAAVDVMYLIDQVAAGTYKRQTIGAYGGDDDSLPRGMVGGFDFDEEDDEWDDEDFEFFDEE